MLNDHYITFLSAKPGRVVNNLKKSLIVEQVKVRLKNKRSARRKSLKGEAIAYYDMHKIAPRIAFEDLLPYHPMSVVAPKYVPPEELPLGESFDF